MKTNYVTPQTKIVEFDDVDIVTVSGVFTSDYSNDNEQKSYDGWWAE